MNQQERSEVTSAWVALKLLVGALDDDVRPSDFPKGREHFIKVKAEQAFIILERMVLRNRKYEDTSCHK